MYLLVVLVFSYPYMLMATSSGDRHLVAKAIETLTEIFRLKDMHFESQSHRKAPQFMLDMFDAVADSNGLTKNSNFLEGNIVRSYTGQSNGTFHFYNITSVARNEKIVKAEFRWFRQKQLFLRGHHFYKVDLYEIMDNTANPWRGNLINSRLLPMYTQGWEVFNITQTVSKWISTSGSNNGLLVVTTLPSLYWNEFLSPGRAQARDDSGAYLVIFSDDGGGWPTNPHFHDGESGDWVPENMSQRRNRRRRSTHESPVDYDSSVVCHRTPLYVDFEKIGWSGWVISPRGYNAYYCKGSCPFPLGESLRATNHATVQAIVNALRLSNEVGAPCCVPDALHPISLLYFDDEENVVLKQYDAMVAGSCGCH